ncbi:MAG: hypothetical protein HXL35_02675 [Prevotellaceae bacterium]|nr:hypothetical protein [Prevotellaceae bacterium]MBF1061622.1 hypothetical protein [Prevotellaceae bacterium]
MLVVRRPSYTLFGDRDTHCSTAVVNAADGRRTTSKSPYLSQQTGRKLITYHNNSTTK